MTSPRISDVFQINEKLSECCHQRTFYGSDISEGLKKTDAAPQVFTHVMRNWFVKRVAVTKLKCWHWNTTFQNCSVAEWMRYIFVTIGTKNRPVTDQKYLRTCWGRTRRNSNFVNWQKKNTIPTGGWKLLQNRTFVISNRSLKIAAGWLG